MKDSYKIVRDPIHGDIKVEGIISDLLETPEVQRLYNIKQLGFAHLVFPGAHHTRLEHSLGTYLLASKIAKKLNITEEEKRQIVCAALLHDIGHGPFSHTFESILLEKFGVDHIDLTKDLILGNYNIFEPNEKEFVDSQSVNNILEKNKIEKNEIVNIIRGETNKKPYLSQILNSTIDVDQLDYLIRDAYYTGVAYGMIDIERLIQTLLINDNNLAIIRKGVSVVESILMARGLMYSSVYFHKTVRISELMLSKALFETEEIEPFEFYKMTDDEILAKLKEVGEFQHEIVTRIKYRKLFKQVYSESYYDLDENQTKILEKLEDPNLRREKEREIENRFGIKKGHLIIDIPRNELLKSEPRINKTEINVIQKSQIKKIDDFTPIARAVKSRMTPDWAVMVITDEKYRNKITDKIQNLIFV